MDLLRSVKKKKKNNYINQNSLFIHIKKTATSCFILSLIFLGSSGGLSLQLNVEQYQYMIGPNEGAGLKVLVHQNDVDGAMKDHGLAIPPGAHAYVAAKIIEVLKLSPHFLLFSKVLSSQNQGPNFSSIRLELVCLMCFC